MAEAGTASKISLTVVVSGAPEEISVNRHDKVEHLMKNALKKAGIEHADLNEWALRKQEGGNPIPPSTRISEAGITDGVTLFLDPDEGGGGETAASPAATESSEAPTLVDPAVSKAKLARELEEWEANSATYRERGYFLLEHGELHADIAFSCRLPIGPSRDLVVIPLAVRLTFENYDVWPPSVKLVDPITRRWLAQHRVAALDFGHPDRSGAIPQVFIGGHPETKKVFLCKRGVREYHNHPEHDGDDWLLYRGTGIGTLAHLCEVIWRLTTRTVTGLLHVARGVQVGDKMLISNEARLNQEDFDAVTGQLEAPLGAQQLPPEIQAQIQAAMQRQG